MYNRIQETLTADNILEHIKLDKQKEMLQQKMLLHFTKTAITIYKE
jgi:hypothetical protein